MNSGFLLNTSVLESTEKRNIYLMNITCIHIYLNITSHLTQANFLKKEIFSVSIYSKILKLHHSRSNKNANIILFQNSI